jgi:hypothetical protein
MGWLGAFDDPIPLPGRRVLRTLRDAGNFIAKLPKRDVSTTLSKADVSSHFGYLLRLSSGSFVALCQGGTLGLSL